MSKIKPRDRDTIVQALRAGVVPKLGLQHIQVGRAREIGELVKDIERISDDGSAIRFVIGEYGSGKTFFSKPNQDNCAREGFGRDVSRSCARSKDICFRRTGPRALCGDGQKYCNPHQA